MDSIGLLPDALLKDSPTEPVCSTLKTAKAPPSVNSAIKYSPYLSKVDFFACALDEIILSAELFGSFESISREIGLPSLSV